MDIKLFIGMLGLIAMAVVMYSVSFQRASAGEKPSASQQATSQTASASTSQPSDLEENDTMAVATFGAGCFWGVEAAFRQIKGVRSTAVGYAGGDVENPTYRQVCDGNTGHAEVVQVEYDPERVGYDELLKVFWESHDPTQVNRQGPDVGYQYRSVIFYHDDEQKKAADDSKAELGRSGEYQRDIATTIEPAPTFWMAEDYHQQYLEKRGLSTCKIDQ